MEYKFIFRNIDDYMQTKQNYIFIHKFNLEYINKGKMNSELTCQDMVRATMIDENVTQLLQATSAITTDTIYRESGLSTEEKKSWKKYILMENSKRKMNTK